MQKITQIISYSLIFVAILVGKPCLAEDGYSPMKDPNIDDYTEATIDTNSFMWITSKWKRSNNHNNWNEPTFDGTGLGALKVNSTFLVKDGIIYLDGAYNDGICSFQRYNAETGEQLSPIEIPIPNTDNNLSQEFITLREDNAGNTYITGACTVALTQIDVFHIDLAKSSVIKQYHIDATKLDDQTSDFNGFHYPTIVGNISSGEFGIWIAYKDLIQLKYNSTTNTFTQYNYSLTHAETGEVFYGGRGIEQPAILTPINQDEFIIDMAATTKTDTPIYCKKVDDDSFIYYHLSSPNKDNCPLPKEYTQNMNLGLYIFEHCGHKMAVYDPYFRKGYQTYFKILHITEPNIAEWTQENSPTLWDITNFATPQNSARRITMAQAVNNGANTDLYLYVSGLGLAAYNIIGPGSTTEIESVNGSTSYTIIDNTILTTSICDINVFNIHGQPVLTKCNTNKASLQELPKGVYMIKMSNNPHAIKVAVR